MNPQYPVYVISKGRWESRLTVRSLEYMKVPYHVVIEPQEYDQYAAVIDPDKIKVLPFSNLGQGSIPARNWCWEDSVKRGFKRHWLMDDNIRHFYRLNRNLKIPVASGTIFKCMEDFVDRYENIMLAGPQYDYFVPGRVGNHPAFTFNSRVYSCLLIDNSIWQGPYTWIKNKGRGYRQLRDRNPIIDEPWRGKYNEDTDLSIRVLKSGHCTILFYAFLQGKTPTMIMKGGNAEELYGLDQSLAESGRDPKVKSGKRYDMAKHLQEQHPELVKIVYKMSKWHHSVDYEPINKTKFKLKDGISIEKGSINNYGMELKYLPGVEPEPMDPYNQ